MTFISYTYTNILWPEIRGDCGCMQLFPPRKETLKATNLLLVVEPKLLIIPGESKMKNSLKYLLLITVIFLIIIFYNAFKQVLILCICSLVHQIIWMTRPDSVVHQAALHA